MGARVVRGCALLFRGLLSLFGDCFLLFGDCCLWMFLGSCCPGLCVVVLGIVFFVQGMLSLFVRGTARDFGWRSVCAWGLCHNVVFVRGVLFLMYMQ